MNQTNNTLYDAETFDKMSKDAVTTYFEMMKPWSDPVYKCRHCGGGMRRENNMVYASNPPCYRYECDTCGKSEFQHI